MSDASAIVDRAAAAVEQADTNEAGQRTGRITTTPKGNAKAVRESAEVAAAPKAAASKKYSDAEKTAAKRAEALRGKARSCGPVQVQRVKSALKGVTATPEDVVKSFKSIKDATAYAGRDKGIEQPTAVKDLSAVIADPFARGRGLVAIALALAGK